MYIPSHTHTHSHIYWSYVFLFFEQTHAHTNILLYLYFVVRQYVCMYLSFWLNRRYHFGKPKKVCERGLLSRLTVRVAAVLKLCSIQFYARLYHDQKSYLACSLSIATYPVAESLNQRKKQCCHCKSLFSVQNLF